MGVEWSHESYRTVSGIVRMRKLPTVRLKQRVSLAARSETIASVKCNESLSLVTADFEPISLRSIPGVYATKCRIIPDVEGVFQITLLNVNDSLIDLYARKCVGNLVGSRIASLQQEPSTSKDQINPAKNLNHGEHLTTDQQFRLEMLITEYSDIFASNPKKPALVKNAEHRIITGDALPVKHKPHRIPEAWHKEVNTQIQEMLGWTSCFTRTLLDSNQLQFRSTKARLKHMREVRIDLDVEHSSHQLQKTGSNLFAILVYQAVRLTSNLVHFS